MSGSLDRNRIMKLFETLSARLAARRIRGQLYIVGGSAMIVGYGRERTTRDVDARIEYAKDEVLARFHGEFYARRRPRLTPCLTPYGADTGASSRVLCRCPTRPSTAKTRPLTAYSTALVASPMRCQRDLS